ncbi:acyl-CoA dehydrogenase family protein [Streptomyces sp. NPDC058464]|uniref:acyl-CoA dehydrogenase family protein n=1 Tax=Streptomyces sp. NPDC058464 TaxID=3346511 RepID=UPI003663177A
MTTSPRLAADAPKHPGPRPRRESPYLSEAGRKVRDAVSEIVPMLREQAVESDELGALTPEMLRALDSAGVFRLAAPAELGGLAGGARDTVEVIAEISRGDGSAGWVAFIGGRSRTLAGFPQPAVDEVFARASEWVGPLVAGASTFAGKVGSAYKVPGGWMAQGTWHFASACKHAAWATAGVEVDEAGHSGRGMVLLTRDQFTILDNWHVMGMAGSSSNSIATESEVFVPDHRFIDMAELPALMKMLRDRYEAATFRGHGGMLITTVSNIAIALGMARGALECFAEQAKARAPFNLPYPTVAEMPSAQVAAGRARAMINAATSVILGHADELDRRALADEPYAPGEETQATMDLVYGAHLCAKAIDLMQNTLGSSTVSLKNPIQRYVRDVRVLTTHGAIRFDPMAEINGRDVFGLEPISLFGAGLPKVA